MSIRLMQKCDDQYQFDIETVKCIKQNYEDDDNDQLIEMQLIYQANLRCGENQVLIDHTCMSQCGNGIIMYQYEECDDGNYYGGDGCSNLCHIEDSQII